MDYVPKIYLKELNCHNLKLRTQIIYFPSFKKTKQKFCGSLGYKKENKIVICQISLGNTENLGKRFLFFL